MSPCILGKTSMQVLSELEGLSQELVDGSAQVLGALQPRCVWRPHPNVQIPLLSALLPIKQLHASTGIFSACSDNFLNMQTTTVLFALGRFLLPLLFLAYCCGLGWSWRCWDHSMGAAGNPCGPFPLGRQHDVFSFSWVPQCLSTPFKPLTVHIHPRVRTQPCYQQPGWHQQFPALPAWLSAPAAWGEVSTSARAGVFFEGKHCVFPAAVPMRRWWKVCVFWQIFCFIVVACSGAAPSSRCLFDKAPEDSVKKLCLVIVVVVSDHNWLGAEGFLRDE